MKLILKYINTLEELKSIIVQNKHDEQFKIELVDSMVDGELQDWLLAHYDDSIDEVKATLDDLDIAKTDSELLQIIYNIVKIDSVVDTPDLSDCFDLVGIRIDDVDMARMPGHNYFSGCGHRHSTIKAVVKVKKTINEKIILQLRKDSLFLSSDFVSIEVCLNKETNTILEIAFPIIRIGNKMVIRYKWHTIAYLNFIGIMF